MTFVVSNFKSRARNWMRPYTYTVRMTPPVGGGRLLEVRTESIALPGVAFASVDNHKPYGNGLLLTIPHTPNVQEIACVHNIDGNGEVIQRLYDWANLIVDLKGDNKFSARYYKDYASTDMTINIYDVQGRQVKVYTLKEVFPLSFDQIQMAWETGGDIAKLNVTYRFRNYEVK